MPTHKPKPTKKTARPARPARTLTSRATATALVKKRATNAVKQAKDASPAKRQKAEDLLAQIARRKLVIAEEFYDIGVALRELLDKKLFAALGYATFAAMLEARDVMSLSQAHKLIRIVESLPRGKALDVGSEKAALLIGYADSTSEPDNAEWLLDTGKLPSGKPVSQASTRELADAVKKARASTVKKKATPEEAHVRSNARAAQAALRKHGAAKATVEVIRRGGAFWLRVELPADAVGLLTR